MHGLLKTTAISWGSARSTLTNGANVPQELNRREQETNGGSAATEQDACPHLGMCARRKASASCYHTASQVGEARANLLHEGVEKDGNDGGGLCGGYCSGMFWIVVVSLVGWAYHSSLASQTERTTWPTARVLSSFTSLQAKATPALTRRATALTSATRHNRNRGCTIRQWSCDSPQSHQSSTVASNLDLHNRPSVLSTTTSRNVILRKTSDWTSSWMTTQEQRF
jgi:hypothetical protein